MTYWPSTLWALTPPAARLTITVTNINDMAPVHTSSVRNFRVVENSPAGSILAVLSFADGDSLPEFRVSAWDIVEGNVGGTFVVDENANLVVRNTTALDREARSITIRIRISNVAPPHLFTDAVYIVTVIDINDNPPSAQQPHDLVLAVEENMPPGTQVGPLWLDDADITSDY